VSTPTPTPAPTAADKKPDGTAAPDKQPVAPVSLTSKEDNKVEKNKIADDEKVTKLDLSDEEWKKKLSPEEFYILRKKGTERAFTGKYDKFYKPGKYLCAGCGLELFTSDTKFDSGCGWPAFYAAKAGDRVKLHEDISFGMVRTEVTCARCDGHLGHVFENEGYSKELVPTGQRFCINSVSIKFVPAEGTKEEKKDEKKESAPTPQK
jgi:peptide-methionine (R)-S-oxide reductase